MTEAKTDRELLELAVKAAGIDAEVHSELGLGPEGLWLKGARSPDNSKYWNPLTDDGDALRLAVKAGIDIQQGWMVSATAWVERSDTHHFSPKEAREEFGNDPYAATRRAIVRAAAAIGEAMK